MHTRIRWLAVLLVLLIVGAACGSDRDDDESAGGQDAETTTTAGGAGGDAKFGDLPSPCGEGDAAGATDQGVTDEKIVIGYGDDAGFPSSPGLNHEMSDAIEAMIKWCNDQGGINGREVEGIYYDAKITEVNNVMLEACRQVFMLVGEGWALDSGQEATRLGCDLPAVPTYSVSPEFANAPLMFQPVPNPVDYTPVQIASAMSEKFPQAIKKTAPMYANYAATIDTKDKMLASYPKFGFEFLNCPQEYSITGEADWRPFAQKLKECGAQVVYFTGSPAPNFQNYLEAAALVDFDPIYITDANFYDQAFAKWNVNGYADKVYIREAYIPLEEASENKATQDYLDIVEANGGDVNQLGQQAASAFLLWATQAKACGAELTRACMLDKLSKVTKWTGGGMHAETSPGENLPPECGLVLKLNGTKFERFHPAKAGTYDCSPEYVVKVTGPVVDRVGLDANRKATKFGS
jgi:ABC-type branched-subunit amino acid transport system substrate-binding protein